MKWMFSAKGPLAAFEPVVELAKEESQGEHEPERDARALFRIGLNSPRALPEP
jgi:hypothetical protein